MRYERPHTVTEACALLKAGATPLAGGTDLLPRYEQGVALPELIVDLKHLDELHEVRERDDGVELGALTTVHELLTTRMIADRYTALAESARDFAAVQIRNRATVGGNLCNASPAGDTLPALYAFNAEVVVARADGERTMPVNEFVLGPGRTVLQSGELLKSIWLPKPPPHSRFFKLGLRDAMAISVLNAAVVGRIEEKRFAELNIAVGAVAPTVVKLERFASALLGGAKSIAELINMVDEEISPIDDIRATAAYRRTVLKNLLEQTLNEMLEMKHE